jgi:DNA polymerase III alpha subunit
VDWEKAAKDAGIQAGFGFEIQLADSEGKGAKPWALATDISAAYRFASLGTITPMDLLERRGVIVFSGHSLSDPDEFDYVDLDWRSRVGAKASLALAARTGKPLALAPVNLYPSPSDWKAYSLLTGDNSPVRPHILTDEELQWEAYSFLDDATLAAALRTTNEIAERCCGLHLPRAPMIQSDGDFLAEVMDGKARRLASGRIREWTDTYEARLRRELEMIAQKGYEPYFLVVGDLVRWAKERMLVGPGRGSSAGSLVCFLLGITEVDPIVHDLLFERFIDVNRSDLPDIDIDFNDQRRHEVFDYLAEKYGKDCVARIGNVNRMKPRSVLNHAGKALGIPLADTYKVADALIEYSSGDSRFGKGLEDTLTGTAQGISFLEKYPEAAIMRDLEETASHTGVHAAGVVVSNVPISNFATVIDGVIQADKKSAEALNLLKIDALGLRTLGVIEDTGAISNEQLYLLPLDDPQVLDVFNEKRFSGIFQFEGAAQRKVAGQVRVSSFQQLDHITALARPGPLGGGATDHYVKRAKGLEPITYRHPSMEAYLGSTLGVVLYQEQVMRISREIGRMSWEEVSRLRRAMSASLGKEYFDKSGENFVEGAIQTGLSAEDAWEVWSEICTFGAWGMNKSHTVSYSIISYWCAYLKRYHRLEFAAACLRGAKDSEQTIELLRELRDEGIEVVPFDPEMSEATWAVIPSFEHGPRIYGGFDNLEGVGPAKAAAFLEARKTPGAWAAAKEKIAKLKVRHSDLSPAHTMWGHIYSDPAAANVNGPISEIGQLNSSSRNPALIVKAVGIVRRDENETLLIQRRGYRKEGQTLFVEVKAVDDSVSKPITLRFRPELWETLGRRVADRLVPGEDWLLVRGKWLDHISMMIVSKARCLNRPEVFND